MRKLFVLLLTLLSAPAFAQDAPVETVIVKGSSLAGVWHGGLLQYDIWSGFFGAPKMQGVVDVFCRIGPRKDDLAISCLQGGPPAPVKTDGTHIHFGASDFEMVSPGLFRGHYQLKRWFITYENPDVSDVSRVTPDPAAPDKAGKAALLRRIFDQGLGSVPRDDAAMKANGPNTEPPQLGAVTTIFYLGQETKWGPLPPGFKLDPAHMDIDHLPHQPDFFSVYLVSFADGERLCGLHQREDGMLDAFRCV